MTHEELLQFFAWCKRYVKVNNFLQELDISQSAFSKYMCGKETYITDRDAERVKNHILKSVIEKIA